MRHPGHRGIIDATPQRRATRLILSMPEPAFRPTEPVFNATYVDALAQLGTVRAYPRNTVVFQEGDRSDQLYVVLSGKLKVFLADSDGREVIVDDDPDRLPGRRIDIGLGRAPSVCSPIWLTAAPGGITMVTT